MKNTVKLVTLTASALLMGTPVLVNALSPIEYPACDGADTGWCLYEATKEIDPLKSKPWATGTIIGVNLEPDVVGPAGPEPVGTAGLVSAAITVNDPLVD